jgi:isopenicillin N synthase-like dioxygenase
MLRKSWFSVLCSLAVSFAGSHVSSVIPVVDIRPLASSEAEEANACADRIGAALSIYGCFIATHTVITTEQVNGANDAARDLFSQDINSLLDSAIPKGGFMRGYLPFGQESGLKSYFEPKEGYSYGYKWGSGQVKSNALHGDNVWPRGSFSVQSAEALEEFFHQTVHVAETISRALSRVVHAGNSTAFDSLLEPGGKISVMRIFHYFSERSAGGKMSEAGMKDKTAMGSSPHTDWGFLTLIHQDDVGGLQFQHNGEWIDVPYIPGSLVVNCGDFLHAQSGGRFHSPVHRVLAPKDRDRTSFVFFYYPKFETKLNSSLFRAPVAQSADILHNSLFDLESADGSVNENVSEDHTTENDRSFGDYIIAKWKGVNAY